MIAALFVDPAGVYSNLPNVDCWGEDRDARLYDGPWPVVAHPPCNRWGSLAYLNQHLHGYKVGDDGGCFKSALRSVRAYGGVLEHPAYSIAWKQFGLPRPRAGGWYRPLFGDEGWVTEVEQSTYGHRARKRTWLYYVNPRREPEPLDWSTVEVSARVSSFAHSAPGAFAGKESERVRPREASATPPAFRDALLSMARTAQGSQVAA